MSGVREVQQAATYALNEGYATAAGERFLQGRCEGLAALRQTVFLLLQTEQNRWPVFSDRFGVALEELLGQPAAYVIPEAERRVREALLQDDRILAVEDFRFEREACWLKVAFVVKSVYGELATEWNLPI